MGISRQSMDDTFGVKRALYLEALRHYITERVANQIRILSAAASALKGVEATLNAAAIAGTKEGDSGCMGLGAISEFGRPGQEIACLTDAAERPRQPPLRHRTDR